MTEPKTTTFNGKHYTAVIGETFAIIKNKVVNKETRINESNMLSMLKEELGVVNEDWTVDDILRSYVKLAKGIV